MKRLRTDGIVLGRTNYGEADRVITFLTPEHGKVGAIAKGVRKPKSKLAGGVELFSVCDVLFLVGRGELYTVASAGVRAHYSNIIKEFERTELAYKFIKLINKATAERPDAGYFSLLETALKSLDDQSIDPRLTEIWFMAQLIELSGYAPELYVDVHENKLSKDKVYDFDYNRMRFYEADGNSDQYTSLHIKFLRLLFGRHSPQSIKRVKGTNELTASCQPLVQAMLSNFVSI